MEKDVELVPTSSTKLSGRTQSPSCWARVMQNARFTCEDRLLLVHASRFPSHPAYVFYRVVFALYFVATIVAYGISGTKTNSDAGWKYLPAYWHGGPNPTFMVYLTDWTYIMQTIFYIIAAVNVAREWQLGGHSTSTPLLSVLDKAHLAMLNLVAGPVILVFVLYWSLDYTPGAYVYFFGVNAHGIQALLMIVDLAVTDLPLRLPMAWIPLIYGTIWSVFDVIYLVSGGRSDVYRAYCVDEKPDPNTFCTLKNAGLCGNLFPEHCDIPTSDPYIYSVLDWNGHPGTAAAYNIPLLLIGVPLFHSAACGVVLLRDFIRSKLK